MYLRGVYGKMIPIKRADEHASYQAGWRDAKQERMDCHMKRITARRTAGALLAGLLLLGLAGCVQDAPPASSTVSEDPAVLYSAPPLLDVDIAALLTVEQVSEALGVEVGEPEVYEDGTWVHYASENLQTTADIHMNEVSRDFYDAQIEEIRATYGDSCEEAPNLGDTALYIRETGELMLYGKGYMIDVVVDLEDDGQADAPLQAARSLAALLLEGL